MTVKRDHFSALAIALFCGAPCAMAQDSVSRNADGGSGLPGDALPAWASYAQRTNYIVDLSPITTSWGTPLGVAPVIKSGRPGALRFNAVNGSAVVSQTSRVSVTFPAASYTLWSSPGGGMNQLESNAALNTSVSPSGSATVLGVAQLDVDEVTISANQYLANQAVTGLIAFDPAQPTRLYVTRIVSAHNSSSPTQLDLSQLGVGAVDAFGNLAVRADGFGAQGAPASTLIWDNYFRVRSASRSGTHNGISNSGAFDVGATDWPLQRDPVTHTVPTLIPADLAGRSVLVGSDFRGNLRVETSPNVITSTTAHRPGTLDHRGSPSVSGRAVFAGSVATGAMLTRSTAGAGRVDAISVFGLSSSGNVSQARTLVVPASIVDGCDAFAWPHEAGGFRGYDSQTTFRGGAGPAAVGVDAQGRGLAAAVLYRGATPDGSNPFNAIATARFNPANGDPAAWTLAAWVDSVAMTGKEVLGDYGADGAPGSGDTGEGDGVVDATDAPIGRLAALNESMLQFNGPSMSSPAFDAAGNVYFIASAALRRWTGSGVVTEYDLGLFRAVLDDSSFCYRLDLVCRVGQVFAGQNSARSYRLAGLNLADADSVSSAALWSGSVSQRAWNGLDTSALASSDPRHLGGMALTARIVYDVDADGDFEDPSAPGGNNASVDEAYNVLLYVGNTLGVPGPVCDADINCDGSADQGDVACMILTIAGEASCFCQADPDFNQDGSADQGDIAAIIQVVAGQPCP